LHRGFFNDNIVDMSENCQKDGNLSIRPVLRFGLVTALAIVGAVVYSNSFKGPFIFDDKQSVVENPYIVHLRPLSNVMLAPPLSTVAGRPIASLSLALNYAVSGYEVWSYHLFNLLVHILAGLTLYGIIRRTLMCERLRERFGKHSAVLAWIAAAIWVVHPIQTESVTYVVQRTESLMGLFYLLTLYSAIRAMEAGGGLLWPAVSVVCCGLGMGTKEAMVTVPAIVLLYDRAFFAGSFIAALRRRWGLYVGIAAMWVILAALLWSGPRQEQSSGFTIAASLGYAANQGIVILRYLRLSVWPRGLCLDYSWPTVKDWGRLALPVLFVLAMLAVTVGGLVRNRAWSYPAAWFFGTLAVTSSFVPVKDLIFEHRMYLPLAGLAVLAVAGGYVLFERRSARKLGVILAAAVICVLGLATFRRNDDYRSAASIWQSVLNIEPDNARAYNGLGTAYGEISDWPKAVEAFKEALRILPDYADAYNNLGVAYDKLGHLEEAVEAYNRAISINSEYSDAYYNLGRTLAMAGRYSEAIPQLYKALSLKPADADAHNYLATALQSEGRLEDAITHYHLALQFKPDYAEAYNNLGGVLLTQGKLDEAADCFRNALHFRPEYADAHNNMGIVLARQGKLEEAMNCYRQSLLLEPMNAHACNNMGLVLQWEGKLNEAMSYFNRSLQAKPDYAEAHYNLGVLYQSQGKLDEAASHYRKVLQSNPEDAEVCYQLGRIFQLQSKVEEAVSCYRRVLQIDPNNSATHEALQGIPKQR